MGPEPDDSKTVIIGHCVGPRRMEGYQTSPVPYILRDYHGERFRGSLTAYVEMEIGQTVTVCRLRGDLKNMICTTGIIAGQKDIPGDCREILRIKLSDAREFIHRTSGSHHVVVYGDLRRQLKELNELFGIKTTEI